MPTGLLDIFLLIAPGGNTFLCLFQLLAATCILDLCVVPSFSSKLIRPVCIPHHSAFPSSVVRPPCLPLGMNRDYTAPTWVSQDSHSTVTALTTVGKLSLPYKVVSSHSDD